MSDNEDSDLEIDDGTQEVLIETDAMLSINSHMVR